MRVAIDARSLNNEHIRGMGRCLWELIARSGASAQTHWHVLSDRPDLPLHVPQNAHVTSHLFECRGYRFRTWEQWALPRKARQLKADLLHCPAGRLPWWQPVPTIVTLHDTMPWQHDEPMWPRGWYTDWLIPRALHKAAAVITVSETSKKDILRRWPNLEAKLHVIPNGICDSYHKVNPGPLSPTLQSMGVQSPYFLYVGGAIERKRPEWAIKVLEQLNDPDVQLVLCGIGRHGQESILRLIPKELQHRVCIPTFVPEEEMPRLYQNAVAVLYPTLYEGFGLPVVEAHAVGTPILFSEVGSLTELVGPSAIVLPTNELSAWIDVCRKLLATRRMHSQPDKSARSWATRFSWSTFADRNLEVYRYVLSYQKKVNSWQHTLEAEKVTSAPLWFS